MKHCPNFYILNVGRCLFGFGLGLVFLTFVSPAIATVADNPYATIVERNAFALKDPPPPPPPLTPPTAPPPNIELRGITTLFGRPQALLNFKVPSKPPEPPKDRSLVMDVEQREGDVQVLEVNPTTGTVRLKVQGNEVSMNLKDNAPKPQFVQGLAAPAIPGLPAVNPVPVPAASAAPVNNIPVPAPGLPTRSLRSQNQTGTAGAGIAGSSSSEANQQADMRTIEANVALYEANRAKNEELIKAGVRLPRMPVHSLLKPAQ